jgi:hypothetical protein
MVEDEAVEEVEGGDAGNGNAVGWQRLGCCFGRPRMGRGAPSFGQSEAVEVPDLGMVACTLQHHSIQRQRVATAAKTAAMVLQKSVDSTKKVLEHAWRILK